LSITQKQADELDKRFTYHAPKPGQPKVYTALRNKAREFALMVMESTPESREQALALTKIEQSVMWANAAIARNE
jgi:hypothetical protein